MGIPITFEGPLLMETVWNPQTPERPFLPRMKRSGRITISFDVHLPTLGSWILLIPISLMPSGRLQRRRNLNIGAGGDSETIDEQI